MKKVLLRLQLLHCCWWPNALVWAFQILQNCLYYRTHCSLESLHITVQKANNLKPSCVQRVYRRKHLVGWEKLRKRYKTSLGWHKLTFLLKKALFLILVSRKQHLEVNKLHQQTSGSTSGSTALSRKQKSEANVGTDSLKLDNSNKTFLLWRYYRWHQGTSWGAIVTWQE